MKSGNSTLYPTPAVAEKVSVYAEEHSTPLPEHITAYHEWVEKNHARSNYMISNFQGQCHVFLARTIGARRVLEIGVYVGYSALVWAHAVGPQCSVTGLEFSDEYAEMAREVFGKNNVNNVEVIQGDALETLPALKPTEPYDLIFIDAQKSGYPSYLRAILAQSQPDAGSGSGSAARLLRPGGLIVADNILRRGLVADDSEANPNAVKGSNQRSEYETDSDLKHIREYNDAVASSPRLETFVMPLYDGLAVSRLLD